MLAVLLALALGAGPELVGAQSPLTLRQRVEFGALPGPIDTTWIVGTSHYQSGATFGLDGGNRTDVALILAGHGLDAGTTIYGIERLGAVELNPLMGPHPSPASVLIVKAGFAAGGIAFCRAARRAGHPRIARVFAIVFGALGALPGTTNAWQMVQ